MFDRSNKYLEILTDAGLLGLLAYFHYLLDCKILRKKSQESFFGFAFWGLLHYFIQLFFIFDF